MKLIKSTVKKSSGVGMQPLSKSHLRMAILFLAPALLLYTLFFIVPALQSLFISLYKWNGFSSQKEFIGLKNFREMLSDGYFWSVVMSNTAKITIFGGILVMAVALLFSGMLSTQMRFKSFYKGLIYFPAILNPVAVGILWSFIYNKEWGLLNSILSVIGLGFWQPTWTHPDHLFWAVLVALVWMSSGFYFLIMYSALERIPHSLVEAAKIEGCNELYIFFKIKIPLIWEIMVTAIIYWAIQSIKQFGLLYAWGGGVDVPPDGLRNLATYMYMMGFGKRVLFFRMGYATAMGVFMFFLVVLVVQVISRVTRKETVEY